MYLLIRKAIIPDHLVFQMIETILQTGSQIRWHKQEFIKTISILRTGHNRQVRSLAVSVRILVRPVITIPVCILGRSENTPFMFVILGEKIEFQTSSINRMLQLFGDIRFMRWTIQQISSPAVFIHMMILECQFTISTRFQVRTETDRLILQFRQLRKTISILIKTGTMTVLAKKI